MAASYKTPGVYVEEIPKFPPSIAQVETAIPAFIGYTEKAEKKGASLINIPTKISSFLEFAQYFGNAFKATITEIKVKGKNNYAFEGITLNKIFYLYDSVRAFYDNGGGDAYIVSVGNYGATIGLGNITTPATNPGFETGLLALEKYDEPTILLFPDAVLLSSNEFYALQQRALKQCADLQDRVAVFDLQENKDGEFKNAVDNFRNNIGSINLKYGNAYAPWLVSAYTKTVNFADFSTIIKDSDNANALVNLETVTVNPALNSLVTAVKVADADRNAYNATITTLKGSSPSISDNYKTLRDAVATATTAPTTKTALTALLTFFQQAASKPVFWLDSFKGTGLLTDTKAYGKSLLGPIAVELLKYEKNAVIIGITTTPTATIHSAYGGTGTANDGLDNTDWLGFTGSTANNASDITASATVYTSAAASLGDLEVLFSRLLDFYSTIEQAVNRQLELSQNLLFDTHPIIANIVSNLRSVLSQIPPSGAIAGVYAAVDNDRGVWKAPANVSLNSIVKPVYNISSREQEGLNVDVVAGKSINAIRAFTGKGNIVWGARTLMGNDNEWRYTSVRRFFNMVEESTKKATEQFVFEPNDANTWVKVQAMIENFLTTLWRAGALAGAKPEHAFYVAVGLGKTMTALDILEGRMIVEIGMAAVRPAEFIILRFSHKMQES